MANYQSGTVTVGTTATLITNVNAPGGILVQNNGSASIYLGGPSVTANQTATGGVTLAMGASVVVPGSAGSADGGLYAIIASSTAKVAWVAAVFTE